MDGIQTFFEKLGWGLTLIEAGGVLAAIVAYIERDKLRLRVLKWLRPVNRFPEVGGELRQQLNADGIVFTVSRPEVPTWVLKEYQPSFAGFIASKDSHAAAEQICETASELGIQCLPIQPIEDPDDPKHSRDACEYLLRMLQQKDAGKIVVDVTGGKVPMTLGAFMAAEAAEVDTIYVSSEYDHCLKTPNMNTARLLRVSNAYVET